MFVIVILLGTILVLALIYLSGKYNENYWKRRGVKFHAKNKILGPFWDFITGDRALFEIFGDYYKQYEGEPAVGIGSLLTPALYVRDPTNVQHVLQLDFSSFSHRGFESFEGDQLSDNITFMNGARWKLMRQNMTPLFTATKLKSMYYIMDRSAQDFIDFLKRNPEKQKGKAFDTLTTFCSAAIAASVFGIGTESIFDSPFLKMARAAVAPTWERNIKFSIASISTRLTKILGIKVFKEHESFFTDAIRQLIQKREVENMKRHDFADICVSLQKNGTMKDHTTGYELEPTVELLAAQAFFFFIAGVEPSTTVIFCTLIELGKNPEILRRVHQEIDDTFEKHKELSYEIVSEMTYLDNVLNESMRKYPPIGFLTRQCVQDTVLPVGNIKVEKGTKIFTPIIEIHHDAKYYPDPEVFDPERFSKDEQHIKDSLYMPFGKGGRACIGARYARMQTKAGLVHLLRHYSIKTIGGDGGIKFKKDQVNVRPANVDVELIPRGIKTE